MTNDIYGVVVSQKVAPISVRDALVNCFSEAHCEATELGGRDLDVEKGYCEQVVKQAFEKVGGDYEKPTKEMLMKVVGYLAEYSEAFRNPEIIEKHRSDIMGLIGRLE